MATWFLNPSCPHANPKQILFCWLDQGSENESKQRSSNKYMDIESSKETNFRPLPGKSHLLPNLISSYYLNPVLLSELYFLHSTKIYDAFNST